MEKKDNMIGDHDNALSFTALMQVHARVLVQPQATPCQLINQHLVGLGTYQGTMVHLWMEILVTKC